MSIEYKFSCPLAHGMHARPASELAEMALGFQAAINITNQRSGIRADVKSVLAIISADIKHGDECLLTVTGADEETSFNTLKIFITTKLPHSDDDLLHNAPQGGVLSRKLPPMLRDHEARALFGRGLGGGIGRGTPHIVQPGFSVHAVNLVTKFGDRDEEQGRLLRALALLSGELEHQQPPDKTAAEIMKAHLAIIKDRTFQNELLRHIVKDGVTADRAVMRGYKALEERFSTLENCYLKERLLDLFDVCNRLVKIIDPTVTETGAITLNKPAVVVAQDLSPSQFLALDKKLLRALILENSSTTSHVIILARSYGVPTIVGVEDAVRRCITFDELMVDACYGFILDASILTARRYFELEASKQKTLSNRAMHRTYESGITFDGRKIDVAANVGGAQESQLAAERGSDGVGLLRSEFLFMDRTTPPDENLQFEEYKKAAQSQGDKGIIIRLLDVGGDKHIPYLPRYNEDNPFLGIRAVRLYPQIEAIITTQLRAILRASAFGKIRIMIPMVALGSEVQYVKSLLTATKAELSTNAIAHDSAMELGVMLEIPAAAFFIPQLAAEVSFFSIGSNDLAQYFFAADRTNPNVSALHDTAHPAFIALLDNIVHSIHAVGRGAYLCGEMAADESLLPILVGLGFDEISVAPAKIPAIKNALRQLDSAACRTLVDKVVTLADSASVRQMTNTAVVMPATASILDEKLIKLTPMGENKAEIIKEMVDLLQLSGRLQDAMLVEEAIWQREATYSTGLGYGFAIPHCKSSAVKHGSIVVVRSPKPIIWGSLDDQPVHMIIMLVMTEQGAQQHLKIFAQLARKMMHEEFRDTLLTLANEESIKEYLTEALG